jgi:putative ABC transport system permease protein
MQANYKPPRFAQKVLLSFLREDISEEVQGDLEELFFSNLEKSTPSRAMLNY